MRWPPPQLLIYAHFIAGLCTMLIWAWVRPPPPARLNGHRGLLLISGNWAYWVTRPMLRALAFMHISPTRLTLIGLGIALFAGIACASEAWGWAGMALLWSGICDLLDGELARGGMRTSSNGAFLDSVCDRLGEIAVFLGIAYSMPSRHFVLAATAAMAASLIVSYTRARGEGLGMNCPGGGFERPGRVVVLMLGLMASAIMPQHHAVLWVEGAVSIVAIGATGTALMRVLALYHLLGAAGAKPAAVAPTLENHANLYRNVVRPQP